MTTPFDLEKWKAGAKPVYRNGTFPVQVLHFDKANSPCPIISLTQKGFWGFEAHYPNGKKFEYGEDCGLDLMLLTEPKRVPLTGTEWIHNGPWWVKRIDDPTMITLVACVDDLGKPITSIGQLIYEKYERTNGKIDVEGKLVWEPCWKEETI